MRFPEHFAEFRDRKIVLYGTGANTEAVLLSYRDSFSFVGLMDRAKTGQTVFGLSVLSEEEVLRRGTEMIIIASKLDVIDTVYQRIAPFCRDHGIRLFDLYGRDELALHRKAENAPFRRLADWKALCGKYRTVSFSVTDTLLGADLFWTASFSVRPMFLELYRWLRERDIRVMLVGSGNFPESLQRRALEEQGITTGGCFFLQDWKEDFYLRLRERCPEGPMLHVGTDLLWDCLAPEMFGIDTARMVYNNPAPGSLGPGREGAGDCQGGSGLSGHAGRMPQGPAGLELGGPAGLDLGGPAGLDLGGLADRHLASGPERRTAAGDGVPPLSAEEVLQAIRESDLVSFDVFDTLLLRIVPEPADVFRLLEKRAAERGIPFSAELRQQLLYFHPEENLEGIYRVMQEELKLTDRERELLLEEELTIEKAVIRPRAAVVSLCREALRQKKTVVLTTDMYLTEEQLEELLSGAGISGYHRLFLSSSVGRKKAQGLFSAVRDYAGPSARILHIGDSRRDDLLSAAPAGIRSLVLPKAAELAEAAGFGRFLQKAESLPKAAGNAQQGSGSPQQGAENLSERLLRGLLVAELYGDPFRESGQVCCPDRESATVFLAAAGYLSWLAGRLRAEKPDRMLFASRDGFLLQEAYELLRQRDPELPPSLYFYTSRRAAFLSCEASEGFAGYFSWRGAGKQPEALMRDVYGLSPEEILPWTTGEPVTPETRKEYILLHAEAIRRREQRARRQFFRYLRGAGIQIGERLGLSELVAAGFCQAFLDRVMPCEISGYYLGRREMEQALPIRVESWLPEGDSLIRSRFMELEYWMAAPEPSVSGYDDSGRPVFFPEERTEEALERLKAVQGVVRRLLKDYFGLLYQPGDVLRPELVLRLCEDIGLPREDLRFFDSWLQEAHGPAEDQRGCSSPALRDLARRAGCR